jgi:hypothetical protein
MFQKILNPFTELIGTVESYVAPLPLPSSSGLLDTNKRVLPYSVSGLGIQGENTPEGTHRELDSRNIPKYDCEIHEGPEPSLLAVVDPSRADPSGNRRDIRREHGSRGYGSDRVVTSSISNPSVPMSYSLVASENSEEGRTGARPDTLTSLCTGISRTATCGGGDDSRILLDVESFTSSPLPV